MSSNSSVKRMNSSVASVRRIFLNIVFVLIKLLRIAYKQDAHFIKEPDRHRNDDERHDVGGRRDDGGDDQNRYDSMAPIHRYQNCR